MPLGVKTLFYWQVGEGIEDFVLRRIRGLRRERESVCRKRVGGSILCSRRKAVRKKFWATVKRFI